MSLLSVPEGDPGTSRGHLCLGQRARVGIDDPGQRPQGHGVGHPGVGDGRLRLGQVKVGRGAHNIGQRLLGVAQTYPGLCHRLLEIRHSLVVQHDQGLSLPHLLSLLNQHTTDTALCAKGEGFAVWVDERPADGDVIDQIAPLHGDDRLILLEGAAIPVTEQYVPPKGAATHGREHYHEGSQLPHFQCSQRIHHRFHFLIFRSHGAVLEDGVRSRVLGMSPSPETHHPTPSRVTGSSNMNLLPCPLTLSARISPP